jgi:DegV family protein with EDD domain
MVTQAKVKIVTDSTCDISQEEAAKLGLTIVPLTVNMDEVYLKDGVDIKPTEFYQKLPKLTKFPSTSQPSVGVFQSVYEDLTKDGSDVVSIHISAKLSGTINSAQLAAQALPPGRVTVIDSAYVSGALAMPVMEALKVAQAGKSAPEVIEVARSAVSRLKMLAVADTLEYLKKGGRIGGLRALAGSILGIKPVFTIANGEIKEFAKPRTKRKALELIADTVKAWGPAERLTILHADSPDEAADLANLLANYFPLKDMHISFVGPVVGAHSGPKTLGVCALLKN